MVQLSPKTCTVRWTGYDRRSGGTSGRHDPRQEPGAVIPPAGICAGGRRATAVPTATIGKCEILLDTHALGCFMKQTSRQMVDFVSRRGAHHGRSKNGALWGAGI